MERTRRQISFTDLSETQLLDLFSQESFSGFRKGIVEELRNKSNRGYLSPRAFKLVYPNAREIYTGMGIDGFIDADGNERLVPLRQLVSTDKEGKEIRSIDYL